ncbi:MAG TPA: hypothetical protein DEF45_14060 [Rhodopirellula sp.]|nr:hypothetical protein [Rhodopirellula sp.]
MKTEHLFASLTCFLAGLIAASHLYAADTATIDFTSQIRPILRDHCLDCHGGVKQAADLSFIHRDAALEVIEPGNPDASVLIERVLSKNAVEVMPPPEHGSPLTGDEIELLTRWIKQGAAWEQPWAYQPAVAPKPPSVSSAQWCKQTLDRFVLASLDQKGISPAQEAPPAQWLRRVTLDLTGLPPTPDQIQQFLRLVKADGQDAYSPTVDQLLKSPGYGERWASVWLDQVRYADSRGLGADGRREIWKYRDWVIDAINDDMPFDEFTIKQIAGDLLPSPTIDDRVATAVHRLTQTNEEGGTDDEEFRINAVLDRVSTVWQTWQGVTFGCVQCHAHPYDPLQHEDFYRFAAFFNNTSDCDLNSELPLLAVPVDPADNAKAGKLDQKITALQHSIWKRESAALDAPEANWQFLTAMTASANKSTEVAVEQRHGRAEYYTIDTLSSNTEITLEMPLNAKSKRLTAIRITIAPGDPEKARRDSEWGFVLSHLQASLKNQKGETDPITFSRVIGDEATPFKNPNDSLNEKTNNGFAAYSRIHYPRTAVFVLESEAEVAEGSTLQIKIRNGVTELGAFPLIAKRGSVAVSREPIFKPLLNAPELLSDQQQLRLLKAERARIPCSNIPVIAERPSHLKRPTHVFTRGLFLTKGKEVQAGVPAALPPLPQPTSDVTSDGSASRLELAQWLINGNNPLTARVTVNRVWARLFGAGIVATEEDFGSSGEPPSHPELLDQLAVQFQNEFEWSQKQLIRTIVLSSTYRQDSKIRPELQETDASNRLLARGPRFRMPAEMIRDNALFISGLLSPQMHGVPVHPPIPGGVWKPFQGGDKWKTPEIGDSDRYRKSIYTYTKRSIPFPMFAAFDAPSREFCTPRRLRSNTPLQALMTLNDATFVECSKALAKKLLDSQPKLEAQLRYGFVAVTSREPNENEMKALAGLYKDCRQQQSNELDSMTAVTSVLLNLDESMSK